MPDGAFYFFLDVRGFGDSLAIAERVLNEHRVIVIPAPGVPGAVLFDYSGPSALWNFLSLAGHAMVLLAALVAVARVYVGVHLPLDVIGGGGKVEAHGTASLGGALPSRAITLEGSGTFAQGVPPSVDTE